MEHQRATAELVEATMLSRALGDVQCLALALGRLALRRLNQGAYVEAVPPAEEALTLSRAAGNVLQAADVHMFLMHSAIGRNDIAAADHLLAAIRAQEGTARPAYALVCESLVAESHGEYARARSFWEDAVRRTAAERGSRALPLSSNAPSSRG